jgi:hypothetical protein
VEIFPMGALGSASADPIAQQLVFARCAVEELHGL